MCVLFRPSKIKSVTLHNLLINLLCGRVVNKAPKSYVATDLAYFFLVRMLVFLMAGPTFWSAQNLVLLERNSGLQWKFSIRE